MASDWLADLLREWAAWYMSSLDGQSNYSDASTLWRAVYEPIHLPPGSAIPKGAIPPPGLNRVQLAMNNLLDSEIGEYIRVLRAYYCFGLERTMESSGLGRRQVFDSKTRGEVAIKAFLRA